MMFSSKKLRISTLPPDTYPPIRQEIGARIVGNRLELHCKITNYFANTQTFQPKFFRYRIFYLFWRFWWPNHQNSVYCRPFLRCP